MSISKYKEVRFVVECDNCHIKSHHLWEAPTDAADAYSSVVARGWSLGEWLDLCASCDHDTRPHWRQHGDAVDAAVVQATKTGERHWVGQCERCLLWTIGLVDV